MSTASGAVTSVVTTCGIASGAAVVAAITSKLVCDQTPFLSLTDLKEKVGTGLRAVHATNKTELTRRPCNILLLL